MKDLILTTLQYLGTCFFVTMLYWLCSGIIHILLYQIGVWDKWKLAIKKRKHPKYLTKVDPIYKLEESEYDSSMYVYKYELGWATRAKTQFYITLLPIPIEILYFEYQSKTGYYACDRKEVIEFSNKYTLEEFYEEKQLEEDAKQTEKQQRNNVINNLNKVFDENYDQ